MNISCSYNQCSFKMMFPICHPMIGLDAWIDRVQSHLCSQTKLMQQRIVVQAIGKFFNRVCLEPWMHFYTMCLVRCLFVVGCFWMNNTTLNKDRPILDKGVVPKARNQMTLVLICNCSSLFLAQPFFTTTSLFTTHNLHSTLGKSTCSLQVNCVLIQSLFTLKEKLVPLHLVDTHNVFLCANLDTKSALNPTSPFDYYDLLASLRTNTTAVGWSVLSVLAVLYDHQGRWLLVHEPAPTTMDGSTGWI